MKIKKNIEHFRAVIPPHCTLIAVSKTQPVEKIIESYEAGQRAFGENKAQEMTAKAESLPNDIQWHMIGHLQTNKVKYIAPFVHLIHGVDSLKLLQEIDKQGAKVNRVIPCLLQIHIAEEETKFGFSEEEVLQLIQSGELENRKHVRVKGLMGMATFTDNTVQIRKEFTQLKSFFNKIKSLQKPDTVEMLELSMGMSNDYTLALACGSTMVRIGTAIFGERNIH